MWRRFGSRANNAERKKQEIAASFASIFNDDLLCRVSSVITRQMMTENKQTNNNNKKHV